jgi:tripartite-type tricarboxylate transporter receptor subunit TctC
MKAFRSQAGAFLLFACSAMVQGLTQTAAAQERFPSKNIEMIVPWGPGSGADILGRLVAKWLETELKVPVPVLNAPGATGSIGINRMLASGAEGYAIAVLTTDSLALAASPEPQVKLGDLTALGVMIRQQSGIYARFDGPYKTWNDVVAAAKANPSKLSVATTGPGSADDATVAYLAKRGVPMTPIGYAKFAERQSAVIGGHLELLYEQAGDVKGQLDAKTLRPLLFFADKRLPAPFADVPVSAEFGYEVVLPQVRTIVARSSADPKRLAMLAAAIGRFAQTPEFVAYLRDQYAQPDSYIPDREAQKFLESELVAMRRFYGGK